MFYNKKTSEIFKKIWANVLSVVQSKILEGAIVMMDDSQPKQDPGDRSSGVKDGDEIEDVGNGIWWEEGEGALVKE